MNIFLLTVLFQSLVGAHVMMRDPPSRRSKYNDYYLEQGLVDYNLMAPLNTPPYAFPCKGYPSGPVSASFSQPSGITVRLEGTAIHGGGHCQFGLSYDNSNFVVLMQVLDNCLIDSMTYNVPIPEDVPDGYTIFFWTWINKIGNREYYMECADIYIENSNGGNVVSGKELIVVNLPGYTVIPEFSSEQSYSGEHLLLSAKTVTIMKSRSSPPAPTTPTTPPPSPAPPAPTPTTSLPPLRELTVLPPVRESDCKQNGSYKCRGAGFMVCDHNKWVYMNCAPGTKCRQISVNNILCDFA